MWASQHVPDNEPDDGRFAAVCAAIMLLVRWRKRPNRVVVVLGLYGPAADHAWACAVNALYSDGSHDISFDRIVRTVLQTGRDMPVEYRETGLGGLAGNCR